MKVEHHENHVTLNLPEMVVIYNGASDLKRTLYSLCEEDVKHIVVDFSQVFMIDSAGLSPLLVSQKRLKERGSSLKIVNISSAYIQEMFNAIELHKVIEIE